MPDDDDEVGLALALRETSGPPAVDAPPLLPESTVDRPPPPPPSLRVAAVVLVGGLFCRLFLLLLS